MSQESIILLTGFLILLLPSLGIPNAYDRWIFVALGLLIAIVGYRLRRAAYLRSIETPHGERRADAYVENPAPQRTAPAERTI
jgi:hypothetical protein